MGATYKVSKVKIMPRSFGQAFPVNFKLQYSTNGTTWTDIAGQSYTNYPNPASAEQTFNFASTVDTRYIRLYATKIGQDAFLSNCMGFSEIRLQ